MSDFQLRSIWEGHKNDVKALATNSDGSVVVSGSRDNKIIIRSNKLVVSFFTKK